MNIQKMIVRLNRRLKANGRMVGYYQSDPLKHLPWIWDKHLPEIDAYAWRQEPGRLTSIDLAWNTQEGCSIDLYTELLSLEHVAYATLIVSAAGRDDLYIKLPSMGMSKLYRSVLDAIHIDSIIETEEEAQLASSIATALCCPRTSSYFLGRCLNDCFLSLRAAYQEIASAINVLRSPYTEDSHDQSC